MARTKRKVNPLQPFTVSEIQPQKKRVYHAGGYARLSVEDSKKPGSDTIENQKEFIRKYIDEQEDMEFCCIYCEKKITDLIQPAGTEYWRKGRNKGFRNFSVGRKPLLFCRL